MSDSWLQSTRRTLGGVISGLLRLLLLAAGAVLGLLALALGLVLTLGLIAWALLRGRKPVLQARAFQWRRRPQPHRPDRTAEVVDVVAHEVPDRPLAQDRTGAQATTPIQPL